MFFSFFNFNHFARIISLIITYMYANTSNEIISQSLMSLSTMAMCIFNFSTSLNLLFGVFFIDVIPIMYHSIRSNLYIVFSAHVEKM